jgi:septum site-determining protein MinC
LFVKAVADGDVIVMGTLLGRVLAGASGNSKAKIFCMSFKGELISVSSVRSFKKKKQTNKQTCFVSSSYLHMCRYISLAMMYRYQQKSLP